MKAPNLRDMILVLSCIVILTCSFIYIATAQADTLTYTYYDDGSLQRAIYASGKTLTYVYDPSGNRTSEAISSEKPVVSVAPTTLDLGSATVGDFSVTKSIVITNTGSGQLDIENTSIGGTNPSEFVIEADHCSGVSLASSVTCAIDITFSPLNTVEDKSAILTIVSDAPDQLTSSATLVGHATLSQLYTLSVTVVGSGTGIIGVDTGTLYWTDSYSGEAIYPANTSVNVSASASSWSSFAGWSGDCAGNGSPCLIQMTSDKSVTATFNSKADFNATPKDGYAPLVVTFTDVSSNNPTSWLWNFGDGGTSTLQSPSYTYTAAGTYSVTLTDTGTGGAATRTKAHYINVSSCNNNPVKIGGTSLYYPSIQSAYNIATSSETIQIQGMPFYEDLNLQNSTSITLQGGYGCDYSVNSGITTIYGSVTIVGGTVALDTVVVQ